MSDHDLDELGPELFATGYMPHRINFGSGFAKGSRDLCDSWQQLIYHIDNSSDTNKDFGVIKGFIEGAASINQKFSQKLLDECSRHPVLRQSLVYLHPINRFTEIDLDRCMKLLDYADIQPFMFEGILWQDEYADLPHERLLDLSERLLKNPSGYNVLLHAFGKKLHGQDLSHYTLGPKFNKLALLAAIQSLAKDQGNHDVMINYYINKIINLVLPLEENEAEKEMWVDTIFSIVDQKYGYISSPLDYIETTVRLMPEAFLNRLFQGTETQQRHYLNYLKMDKPLSKVDVNTLIKWCEKDNYEDTWTLIANGMKIWGEGDESQSASIEGSAIRFLEASPEPKKVMEAFVSLNSWSGNRSDALQKKVDGIGRLKKHTQSNIAEAANLISKNLSMYIKSARMDEQALHIKQEQRFE